MEMLLKIVSIISLTILPLKKEVNENLSRVGLTGLSEFETLTDSSRKSLLINVDTFYLEIIPPSSGVQFYKDGIVFLSSSKYEGKMLPGQISFGAPEVYFAVPEDSTTGKHVVFSTTASFSYPCDALTFSNDFNTMYYTRFLKTIRKEKIYQAKFSTGISGQAGWTENTEPMEFCKDDFNYSHPALSVDGKIMVFSSNRTGSVGGMDLFVIKKEGDLWSVPQKPGDAINTKGNELFSFLDSKNNLYFSSDGLPGKGGYDIFTCKFNGKTWDNPVNLTQIINSENDDVAFTLSRNDEKSGFFTSGKNSRKRDMQLYKITLNNNYENNSLKNLPDILYSMATFNTDLNAVKSEGSVKTINTLPAKPDTGTEVIGKDPVEKPVKTAVIPDKKVSTTSVTQTKTGESKVAAATPAVNKPKVIYRVQVAANVKAKGSYKIIIKGKSYNTFEYLYNKAYRSTVGAFGTLTAAKEFQTTLKQSGYPNAFVVAFKNNVRSLDPELFK